jgi:RNA polymerase sigma-70 factor (ECF subfamily)
MDKELLQEMVEKYGNMVYRLAWRSTGSRDQAEDITQETFLRAFTHLDSYDRNRPPGPWLCRIALNLCRNRYRQAREIPVDCMEEGMAAPQPGPEQRFLEQEREQEIIRAVQSLPPMYREVILLKHVSGLSYAEISAVLDLEISLVKNRLYRGRLMLREALHLQVNQKEEKDR